MSNWCFNTVRFRGKPAVIDQLTQYLSAMAERGQETGQGQLPEFSVCDEGFMFNIGWSGEFYFYATKNQPNTAVLVEIAERYGLSFKHEFEETANCIYGVAIYRNGELSVTELDEDDFTAFELNENTQTYEFEGQHYESSEDILQILLERKSAIQNLIS